VTNFSPLVFSNAQATIGGVNGSINSTWPNGYSIYDITLVNQQNRPQDAVSALSTSGSGTGSTSTFTITYVSNTVKNGTPGQHSQFLQFLAGTTDASLVAKPSSSFEGAALAVGMSTITTTGSTLNASVVQGSPSAFLDTMPSVGVPGGRNDASNGDRASELLPDPVPMERDNLQIALPALPEDAMPSLELGNVPALDAYFANQAGAGVTSAAAAVMLSDSDAQLDGFLADAPNFDG
jgi:hypothetical protein